MPVPTTRRRTGLREEPCRLGVYDPVRTGATARATQPGTRPQGQHWQPEEKRNMWAGPAAGGGPSLSGPQRFRLLWESFVGTGRGPSLHKGEHGPARCSHFSSFHRLPSSPARRPGEHRPGRDIQPLATAAAPAASSAERLVLGVHPHRAPTLATRPLPSLPN